METKLVRISQLSKENPDVVFTSLGHLINKEMFYIILPRLVVCFWGVIR